MPVKVVKRRGRFRVVEAAGRIAKTKTGASVDGGGHSTKAKAKKQAAAINSKSR